MKQKELAALYQMNLIEPEKLPALAVQWIEAGVESQALMDIAWESSANRSTMMPLLKTMFSELKIKIPNESEALLILTGKLCQDIIDQSITPFEGAYNIWQDICQYDNAPQLAFDFIPLADAIQNIGELGDIDQYNLMIMTKAQQLIRETNYQI